MPKIIVSYRRSDTQAVAGRIVDRLTAHFGDKSVFLDVDNIPFGIDFRDHIQSALSQADVLIAVVGPDWLGTTADGGARIEEEDDPVRVEIETALRQNLLVIPVLVGGATIPAANALPDSLKSFAFINAAPVDAGRDFRPHVDRLIKSIEEVLGQRSGGADGGSPKRTDAAAVPRAAAPTAQQRSAMRLSTTAAFVAVVAGGLAWLTGAFPLSQHPTPAPVARAPVAAAPPAPVTVVNAPTAPAPDQAAPPPVVTTSAPTQPPAAPRRANPIDDLQWNNVDKKDVGALRYFVDNNPYSRHLHDAEVLIAKLTGKPAP